MSTHISKVQPKHLTIPRLVKRGYTNFTTTERTHSGHKNVVCTKSGPIDYSDIQLLKKLKSELECQVFISHNDIVNGIDTKSMVELDMLEFNYVN